MHYLSFLADKLATICESQADPSSSDQENMLPHEPALATSLRLVLEQEVASGRLHYNALHSDLEMLADREKAMPCFPEWADQKFDRGFEKL